jgi:extradiol dioxygenase family protein
MDSTNTDLAFNSGSGFDGHLTMDDSEGIKLIDNNDSVEYAYLQIKPAAQNGDIQLVNNYIGGERQLYVGANTVSAVVNDGGTGSAAIYVDTTGGLGRIQIQGGAGFKGIQYLSDYSADYTSRSLIDKGYADTTYAPISGSANYWNTSGTTTLTSANTISGNFDKYFTGTGGFVIGHSALTNTDSRLQVRGTGTTTNIIALFEDSSGTSRLSVLDNGRMSGTITNQFTYTASPASDGSAFLLQQNGSATNVKHQINATIAQYILANGSGTLKGRFIFNTYLGVESLDNTLPVTVFIPIVSATSGNYTALRLANGGGTAFNPSSGSATYTSLLIDPTYNVTGGATTVRGIDYNPSAVSMTGVTQYAITTSVGLHGFGIRTPTAKLQVRGDGTTTGNLFLAEDSAGTDRFSVLDNGEIYGSLINLYGNTAPYSTRIGYLAGSTSGTTDNYSISIGYQANGQTYNIGSNSIAIGRVSHSVGASSVAVGYGAAVDDYQSVAFGASAWSSSSNGVALGYGTVASQQSISIGSDAGNTSGTKNASHISIGYHANQGSYNIGTGSISIGNTAISKADYGISIGANAGLTSGSADIESISVGYDANNGSNAIGLRSISIGKSSKSIGNFDISMGFEAGASTASGTYNISIGNQANKNISTGLGGIAIGSNSESTGANAIALGNIAKGSATNAIAIGYDVDNATTNSFGIGWSGSTPKILLAETADMYINNTTGGLVLGSNTVTANTKLDIRAQGTGSERILRLATSANSEKAYFLADGTVVMGNGGGNVGIGVSPSYRLDVNGSFGVNAGGGVNNILTILSTGLTASMAKYDLTQNATTGSTPIGLLYTGGAHTTLAASTEATDVNFNLARTVQFATGALATQRAFRIQAPTYGFVGASTITNASTLSISGAPIAGTNATITNAYALRVESGATQLNGNTSILGSYNSVGVAPQTGHKLTIRGNTNDNSESGLLVQSLDGTLKFYVDNSGRVGVNGFPTNASLNVYPRASGASEPNINVVTDTASGSAYGIQATSSTTASTGSIGNILTGSSTGGAAVFSLPKGQDQIGFQTRLSHKNSHGIFVSQQGASITDYDGYMAVFQYAISNLNPNMTGSTSNPMVSIRKVGATLNGFDHTGAFLEMTNGFGATGDFIKAWDGTTNRFVVDYKGQVSINQLASTSGSPTGLLFTGGAHTALTASTEATDINFNLNRTVQFSSGAITNQRAIRIQAPTYSFTSASTITSASTLNISGAPVAGTNATITNGYALSISGGGMHVTGRATFASNLINMPYQSSLTAPSSLSDLLQARVLGTTSEYYGLIGTIGGTYYLRQYELAYGWNISGNSDNQEITDAFGNSLDYTNTSYHIEITETVSGGNEVYEAYIWGGASPTVTIIRPSTNITTAVVSGHVEVSNSGSNPNWQGFVKPLPKYSATYKPWQANWAWNQAGTETSLSVDKFGINDTTPSYQLDVYDDAASSYTASFFNDGNNDNRWGIQIQAGLDAPSAGKWIQFNDGDGGDVGSICYTGGQANICSPSDMNLKKNITTLLDDSSWSLRENITTQDATVLDKVLAITPVIYNWNSEEDGTTRHAGFIAQEIEQVFPDLVHTNENGLKSINYTALMPYAIESIQELHSEIKNLEDLSNADNTFRTSLMAWLGDMNNGLEQIFAKKLKAEELCLQDSTGSETCVTKSQIDSILQLLNTGQASTEPIVESTPTESTEATIETTQSEESATPTEVPVGEVAPAVTE